MEMRETDKERRKNTRRGGNSRRGEIDKEKEKESRRWGRR